MGTLRPKAWQETIRGEGLRFRAGVGPGSGSTQALELSQVLSLLGLSFPSCTQLVLLGSPRGPRISRQGSSAHDSYKLWTPFQNQPQGLLLLVEMALVARVCPDP